MTSSAADVLVIGAGPAGLYLAGSLARAGHRVIVCEEHPTIGDPVHCTGLLATEAFDEFELPRDAILNTVARVQFFSPSGLLIEYSSRKPPAAVIDRGRFDRALAERAEAAGVEIRLNTRVQDLATRDEAVEAMAAGTRIRARLAVLACGARYAVQQAKRLGIPNVFLHTAQREVPAGRLHDVEVHFGRDVAPGGFAWAVPVRRPGGNCVRIGVMASHDAPGYFRRMIARVENRWHIAPPIAAPRLKILPLSSIRRTYSHRLLVIGDAAGLVKPTTGGGIYYAIVSARLAADVATDALRRNRLDEATLSPYEARWRGRLEREFDAQQAMRRAALALSDQEIDAFFDLAQTDGVMPLVRKTAKFNEHRHLIGALFKHPPARRILLRAVTS